MKLKVGIHQNALLLVGFNWSLATTWILTRRKCPIEIQYTLVIPCTLKVKKISFRLGYSSLHIRSRSMPLAPREWG